MEKWFDITDEELMLIDEYVEKICLDEEDTVEVINYISSAKKRTNSWIRKNKYRKKQLKRFLSLKPDMTSDECFPLRRTRNIIYINVETSTNGGCYCLNHVNHLYMTKRGYVEQLRGRVEWWPGGSVFGIEEKNRDIGKITNRRIRHEDFDVDEGEVLKYSTYKKKYGPKLMDVI